MNLSNLPKKPGIKSEKKRVGRGYGSGKGGHTTGRGAKGQKVRNTVNAGFEGGQSPLYKKMPKLPGFINHAAKKIAVFKVVQLNRFKEGSIVTPESFVELGLLKKVPKHGVKIISNGNLHKKLELNGLLLTKGAREKIEKSGSKITEQK